MTPQKRDDRLSRRDALERFGSSLPEAIRRQQARTETDIVTWAEQNFYVADGTLIRLEPHQQAILRLLVRPRDDGSCYTTLVISTVKKSGKTALAALFTQFDAETGPPGREILLAANDREQAANRVFEAIRTSIERDPRPRPEWTITANELRHVSGTRIRAIANDFRGEAGANPSLTVWTELWGFEHENSIRLFEELTPVPTLESIRLVETSAGYEGSSGLLNELYELGRSGRQLTAGELSGLTETSLGSFAEASTVDDQVPIWVNDAAGVVMYWDVGPMARRMPWQRGEAGERYYREQERTLRPSQYQRLHRNEWTQADEAFVPIEWWDAGLDPSLPPADPHDSYFIGVDGAVKGDGFALVAVTRDPRRRDDAIVVRGAKLFTAPPGGFIDFDGPRAALQHAIDSVRVAQIAFDPFQLHDFMQGFKQTWTYEFNQQTGRAMADRRLFDLLREGRISHFGVPQLRDHLLNANVKLTGESQMRLEKRSAGLKIDLAVALSMAAFECLRCNV